MASDTGSYPSVEGRVGHRQVVRPTCVSVIDAPERFTNSYRGWSLCGPYTMAPSAAIRDRYQKQTLPTATPNSARYFILIATLSMLANQCLEHAREPRRK